MIDKKRVLSNKAIEISYYKWIKLIKKILILKHVKNTR